MNHVALSAEQLRKTYGTGEMAVHALHDISFSMHSGEIVALLGPSGAGKSTLLTALGLIQPPDSGRITIAGKTVPDIRCICNQSVSLHTSEGLTGILQKALPMF